MLTAQNLIYDQEETSDRRSAIICRGFWFYIYKGIIVLLFVVEAAKLSVHVSVVDSILIDWRFPPFSNSPIWLFAISSV
jgi:hypothetical protein